MTQDTPTFTAFVGHSRLAGGPLAAVVSRVKAERDAGCEARLALFEDRGARAIDVDLRGTLEDVLARLADHPLVGTAPSAPEPPRGRGRPRLGVVSREVSLLPRHWAYLAAQRGGASAALRRLVDEARRQVTGDDRDRRAVDAAYRFMQDMAGDLPGFEEASRALFGGDRAGFLALIADWPADLREYLVRLRGAPD